MGFNSGFKGLNPMHYPQHFARASAIWQTPTQHFPLRHPEKPVVKYHELFVPVQELLVDVTSISPLPHDPKQ